MPSQDEKERRRYILAQQRAATEAALLANMPLSLPQLKALFDYLDEQLGEEGCDDTLRRTQEFAAAAGISFEPLRAWLAEQGGYCDCEVLANVEETYERWLPG